MTKARRLLLSQVLNHVHGSDSKEAAEEVYNAIVENLGASELNKMLGHETIVQRLIADKDKLVAEADDQAGQEVSTERKRAAEIEDMVYRADCRNLRFPKHCFDSIITDPPYKIRVFEEAWDSGQGIYKFTLEWLPRHLEALKPGGFVAVFINTRQYDLVVRALRECKLIVRDPLLWIRYSPKIPGKRLDKEGMVYTTLKYCAEIIAVAQKPPEGTYRKNFKKYGVGGYFFEGALLPFTDEADRKRVETVGAQFTELSSTGRLGGRGYRSLQQNAKGWYQVEGRRPSNVIVLPEEGAVLPKKFRPYFVIPTIHVKSKEATSHETQKR
jgi:hypothetical protein